ncbi:small muscular protein [Petromyzon marinus]|uniref:small muscular protein n=1 Tax=Petromyzon marinus TaxID=7757 RepID=UPI003F6F2EAC
MSRQPSSNIRSMQASMNIPMGGLKPGAVPPGLRKNAAGPGEDSQCQGGGKKPMPGAVKLPGPAVNQQHIQHARGDLRVVPKNSP